MLRPWTTIRTGDEPALCREPVQDGIHRRDRHRHQRNCPPRRVADAAAKRASARLQVERVGQAFPVVRKPERFIGRERDDGQDGEPGRSRPRSAREHEDREHQDAPHRPGRGVRQRKKTEHERVNRPQAIQAPEGVQQDGHLQYTS